MLYDLVNLYSGPETIGTKNNTLKVPVKSK